MEPFKIIYGSTNIIFDPALRILHMDASESAQDGYWFVCEVNLRGFVTIDSRSFFDGISNARKKDRFKDLIKDHQVLDFLRRNSWMMGDPIDLWEKI